ncbi:unnamed protein product [Chrysoparadoxa australica]
MLFWDLLNFLVYFLSLTMTCYFLARWWHGYRHLCPLDVVVRAYGLGFFGLYIAVTLAALFILFPLEGFLFGRVVSTSLAFACIVGLEELGKVCLACWTKGKLEMQTETKAHQLAYVATSAGYATAGTITWLVVLRKVLITYLGLDDSFLIDSLATIFINVIFFSLTVPLHVLSGYLIGLETTRKTPFHKVALWPFALRSLCSVQAWFMSWLCSKYISNDSGPILATILGLWFPIGVAIVMVRRIKQVEQDLPQEYLSRVGYLHAFGYGVLPSGDEEELELGQQGNEGGMNHFV